MLTTTDPAIVWSDFQIWRAKGSTTLLPPAPGPSAPCIHSTVGHLFLLPRENPWYGHNSQESMSYVCYPHSKSSLQKASDIGVTTGGF